MPDPPRYVTFASNGGAPTNPGWYHNFEAQPNTTIEVGTEEAAGAELERIFRKEPSASGNSLNTHQRSR